MKDDILNFEVRLFSPDGVNSPVLDYLDDLADISEEAHIKCVDQILNLPSLIFVRHKSVKAFKIKDYSLFELKIQHKNNTFSFFFIMEKPNVIVVYGFTKKTQKTEQKDIKNGTENLKNYLQKPKSISLDN